MGIHIRIKKTVSVMLAMTFLLTTAGVTGAFAADNIYVNDPQSVLSGGVGSAYAIGSGGVSTVGDTYVATGDGVVKLGSTGGGGSGGTGGSVNGEPDGTTVSVGVKAARIGLYYYYSSGRNTSLDEARLENAVGSGYKFGYYDSARSFHELGSTAVTAITMRPSGSGRQVEVYDTNNGALIFTHTDQSTNLAVLPVSNGAKAETWFKGNTYMGGFEYYRYNGGNLTVINVVDIEDYIKGVITIEMSSSWPVEALKAQALCARTYFASNINSYAKYGFDITADTYCQAYLGSKRSTANSNAAVDATAGEYVTYGGKLCSTLYFSSDGGATEDSENIFTSALPYLRGKTDPYEASLSASENSYSSWTRTYTGDELRAKLSARGYSIGTVTSVTPEYSAMGNVIKLTFKDSGGGTATVTKSACYSTPGLPSVRYSVSQSGDSFVFNGSGYGHNVGMSQWGAYSMAKYHSMNYRQIIRFYYTDVSISTGV